MASLLDELNIGRKRIGLRGWDGSSSNITIDVDVTNSFTTSYSAQITNHPIERDESNNNPTYITDHVMPSDVSLTIDCILSDNLNIFSSAGSFSNKSVSVKDKLSKLLFWHRSGVPIDFLGYGTESYFSTDTGYSTIGQVLSYFQSGLTLNTKDSEDHFLGLDSDKIEGLVIEKITNVRNKELGKDVKCSITFKKIFLAIAKTFDKESGKVETKIKKVDPPKVDTPVKQTKMHKKFYGKPKPK